MLLMLIGLFFFALLQFSFFLWLRNEFSKLNTARMALLEAQIGLEAELVQSAELSNSARELYKKANEDRLKIFNPSPLKSNFLN